MILWDKRGASETREMPFGYSLQVLSRDNLETEINLWQRQPSPCIAKPCKAVKLWIILRTH